MEAKESVEKVERIETKLRDYTMTGLLRRRALDKSESSITWPYIYEKTKEGELRQTPRTPPFSAVLAS
jgi:hypothetical protein